MVETLGDYDLYSSSPSASSALDSALGLFIFRLSVSHISGLAECASFVYQMWSFVDLQ